MGSYSVGCLFSSLPIEYSNSVVSYVVMKEKISPSFMFESKYRPIPFPIVGKYDDYGFLEEIENPKNVVKILNFINKMEFKFSKSFREIKDFNYFYEEFIRNRKGFFDYNIVFFHKEIYLNVLNELFNRTCGGEIIKEYLHKKLEDDLNFDKKDPIFNSRFNYFCPYNQEIILCKNDILMFFENSDLNNLVETKVICNALGFLRKDWSEGIVGSQTREFYIQKVISESTLNYIEKYKKDLLEDPYADEDTTEENVEETLKEDIR